MTSADYMEYKKQYQKINHKKLIPESALKNSKTLEIKQTSEEVIPTEILTACTLNTTIQNETQINTIKENIKKHREIEDFVSDLADYNILNCDCVTKIKIPQEYKNKIIL